MIKNAKLQNLIRFSHKVTIYVPGTQGANTEADNAEWVDRTAQTLSEMFGGATSTPGRGYWMSTQHGLIRENTTLVFAYAKEADLIASSDALVEYLETMKQGMEQEAVAMELDGEMLFV